MLPEPLQNPLHYSPLWTHSARIHSVRAFSERTGVYPVDTVYSMHRLWALRPSGFGAGTLQSTLPPSWRWVTNEHYCSRYTEGTAQKPLKPLKPLELKRLCWRHYTECTGVRSTATAFVTYSSLKWRTPKFWTRSQKFCFRTISVLSELFVPHRSLPHLSECIKLFAFDSTCLHVRFGCSHRRLVCLVVVDWPVSVDLVVVWQVSVNFIVGWKVSVNLVLRKFQPRTTAFDASNMFNSRLPSTLA